MWCLLLVLITPIMLKLGLAVRTDLILMLFDTIVAATCIVLPCHLVRVLRVEALARQAHHWWLRCIGNLVVVNRLVPKTRWLRVLRIGLLMLHLWLIARGLTLPLYRFLGKGLRRMILLLLPVKLLLETTN